MRRNFWAFVPRIYTILKVELKIKMSQKFKKKEVIEGLTKKENLLVFVLSINKNNIFKLPKFLIQQRKQL